MSDAPDIKDELERKVTETLTETLRKLSQGQCTPEATSASLWALWGAASGLVSQELMGMIADSKDAIEEERAAPRMRLFMNGESVMAITLPEETSVSSEIIMMLKGGSKRKPVLKEDDTLKEAIDKVEKVANNLLEMGYKEIT